MTTHVPPLRFHALTRLYDAVVAATTREERFKRALMAKIEMPDDGKLLDLGCGTGTMTRWIREAWPEATITGVDADAQALAIARSKPSIDSIEFIQADARSIPRPDGSVDVITSSLFFHHLTDTEKQFVLAEAARLLRYGGQLLVADWGRPKSVGTALGFFLVRCLDGFSRTRANAAGELPAMIEQAGVSQVSEFDRVPTVFGEIQLLSALKPAQPA